MWYLNISSWSDFFVVFLFCAFFQVQCLGFLSQSFKVFMVFFGDEQSKQLVNAFFIKVTWPQTSWNIKSLRFLSAFHIPKSSPSYSQVPTIMFFFGASFLNSSIGFGRKSLGLEPMTGAKSSPIFETSTPFRVSRRFSNSFSFFVRRKANMLSLALSSGKKQTTYLNSCRKYNLWFLSRPNTFCRQTLCMHWSVDSFPLYSTHILHFQPLGSLDERDLQELNFNSTCFWPEHKPLECGLNASRSTLTPPALWPNTVTLRGSPPNAWTLSRTHWRAIVMSQSPKFPGHTWSPVEKKPRSPRRYWIVTTTTPWRHKYLKIPPGVRTAEWMWNLIVCWYECQEQSREQFPRLKYVLDDYTLSDHSVTCSLCDVHNLNNLVTKLT